MREVLGWSLRDPLGFHWPRRLRRLRACAFARSVGVEGRAESGTTRRRPERIGEERVFERPHV